MTKIGVDVKKEHIIATSAREQMIQAGSDGLVPGEVISMMAGQKNINSKLSYLEQKEKKHQAAQMVINRKSCGKTSGVSFPAIYKNLLADDAKEGQEIGVDQEQGIEQKDVEDELVPPEQRYLQSLAAETLMSFTTMTCRTRDTHQVWRSRS